jgi:hypothetical protein
MYKTNFGFTKRMKLSGNARYSLLLWFPVLRRHSYPAAFFGVCIALAIIGIFLAIIWIKHISRLFTQHTPVILDVVWKIIVGITEVEDQFSKMAKCVTLEWFSEEIGHHLLCRAETHGDFTTCSAIGDEEVADMNVPSALTT